MADLVLCTHQDVIDVFGGNLVSMRQLVGASGTSFDATTLDKPILVASSEIDAAAGNKFGIGYNADPATYSMRVRTLTATRAAYWFWIFNAGGKAMPAELKSVIEAVDAELVKLEDGKKGLGQNKAPPSRVSSYIVADLGPGRATVASFRKW